MKNFTYEEIKRLNEMLDSIDYGHITVSATTVKKNREVKEGLMVHNALNANVAPTVYIQDDMTEDQIIHLVIKAAAETPQFTDDISNIFERDYILSNVYPRVVGLWVNGEMNPYLDSRIYDEFMDLAIMYYIRLTDCPDGCHTITISKEQFAKMNVTAAEIRAHALDNMRKEETCDSMLKVLMEISGSDFFGEPSDDEPCYVLSNQKRVNGAAVITDEEFLEKISERLKKPFYVLPSSIHEVLICPVDEPTAEASENFYNMVKEVNSTQVAPEDQLSDSVYFYSIENGLELVA